jgi:protein-disulfide isomerase
VAPLLEQVMQKYPRDVRVVVKQFPLTSIHPFAQPAALAALAAQDQGKFWPVHDLLFKAGAQLNDQTIRQAAETAGLDMAAFDRSVKDPRIAAAVERDLKDGVEAGVRGTPSIFVNGRLVQGRTVEGLLQAVEAQLKKAPGKKGAN